MPAARHPTVPRTDDDRRRLDSADGGGDARASLLRAAGLYMERGWVLTPTRASTTKGAYLPAWSTRRLTLSELGREIDRPGKGIGVVLGESSGELVDVDLDHPAAVAAADLLLPPTALVSGRTGRPRTHRFYRAAGAVYAPFKTAATGMLVELRAAACQTLLPPSPHPEGRYHWDAEGEPALVDAALLQRRVAEIAAAGLLIARGWEPERAAAFARDPDLEQLAEEELNDGECAAIRSWLSLDSPPETCSQPPKAKSDRTVSPYTQAILERTGGVVGAARLLGLELREGHQPCPWHEGKGARSLQVTGSLWRCHAGCGAGNPIHLAMKVQGLDYRDARNALAARLGLTWQECDPRGGEGLNDRVAAAPSSSEEAPSTKEADGVEQGPAASEPAERGTSPPASEPAERDTARAASSTSALALPPGAQAGVLLVASSLLAEHGFSRPSVAKVIRATGVSRARAYELRSAILEVLPSLVRPVGRPQRTPTPTSPSRLVALTGEVRDFLLQRPGVAQVGSLRRWYSDQFRHFVLELRARYDEIGEGDFACAVGVPPRTLNDWMRAGPAEPDPATVAPEHTADGSDSGPPEHSTDGSDSGPPDPARQARIQTILRAWETWNGTLIAFCEHVHEQLRIPYGRTLISRILEVHGERKPRRRPGRSPDVSALKEQFALFFPGAQWSADGKQVSVDVARQVFTFNFELVVDPASGAFLGMSVSDEEDGKAVADAVSDAKNETGAAPIAFLLDNRPSNHTEEVDAALGDDTFRIRSTPYRPENKAHSEGAFGLFSQAVPPLSLPSLEPYDVARRTVELAAQIWCRVTNHRPRRDRDGKSRVELYRAADPTPEELEQAHQALKDIAHRQEQARRTREARQDPVVRRALDTAFERLGLADPQGHVRIAIARYALDHVLAGIAVFEGMREANTLPPDVDGRYMLGIVRNIAHDDEGLAITSALWRERLAARDAILVALDRQRGLTEALAADPHDLVTRLTHHLTAADRALDRSFWLHALADAILAHADLLQLLYHFAARRIHATHQLPQRERQAHVRRLAALLLPTS